MKKKYIGWTLNIIIRLEQAAILCIGLKLFIFFPRQIMDTLSSVCLVEIILLYCTFIMYSIIQRYSISKVNSKSIVLSTWIMNRFYI